MPAIEIFRNFIRNTTIMKTIIVFAALTLICCKKQETISIPDVQKKITTGISKNECYSGILKNDTISMNLTFKDSIVEGKLSYHFFEKDKNDGTLSGRMKGDTLLAAYTFQSEGKESIREVAFLKKGNTFTEGYTDVEEKENIIVFKDKSKLDFNSKTILTQTDCK